MYQIWWKSAVSFGSYGEFKVDLFEDLIQGLKRHLRSPKSIGFVLSSYSISMPNLVGIGAAVKELERIRTDGRTDGRTAGFFEETIIYH